MKITKEMVEQAYLFAKKVYAQEMPRDISKFKVNDVSGMNMGSAQDYITVFLAMMEGMEYRRTINTYATQYYFENIYKDFGIEKLRKAIDAAGKHTKYYKTLGHGSLNSIENVVEEFRNNFTQ